MSTLVNLLEKSKNWPAGGTQDKIFKFHERCVYRKKENHMKWQVYLIQLEDFVEISVPELRMCYGCWHLHKRDKVLIFFIYSKGDEEQTFEESNK